MLSQKFRATGIIIGCCLLFLVFTGMMGPDDDQMESRQLHQEILLLNLVNGLDLTAAQIQEMLPLLKQAQQSHELFRQDTAVLKADMVPVLEKIRDQLKFNRDIDEKTRKELEKTRSPFQEARENFMSNQREIVKAVMSILTDEQKQSLKEFRPCIMPASDQTRIGQPEKSRGRRGGAILDRMRDMPDEMFDERIDTFLDRASARAKNRAGSGFNEEEFRNRLETLIAKARNMNDAEYQLNKDDLLQSIMPRKHNHQNPSNREFRGGMKNRMHNRTMTRLFLNPQLITILEEQLIQARASEP